MGRIRRNIEVNGKNYWTLFDSGARNTYVTNGVTKQLPVFDMPEPTDVSLGGKEHFIAKFCNLVGKIVKDDNVIGVLENYSFFTHARVLDNIGKDEEGKFIEILFGVLAMQEWGIKLDVPGEKLDMTHYSKEFVEF
ncbi:MAG: hypothetical protein HY840_11825 [Bacteroidetes bacterium]|nr:hypothetical protein [Bacteroidota bacterium]